MSFLSIPSESKVPFVLICSLARTAEALGWLVLVAMVLWVVYYVHTRHTGARRVTMAEVRARLMAPVTSGAPGWRQDDLLALRSRVEAQFRSVLAGRHVIRETQLNSRL